MVTTKKDANNKLANEAKQVWKLILCKRGLLTPGCDGGDNGDDDGDEDDVSTAGASSLQELDDASSADVEAMLGSGEQIEKPYDLDERAGSSSDDEDSDHQKVFEV